MDIIKPLTEGRCNMAMDGITNSAVAGYAAEAAKTSDTARSEKTYTGGRTVGNPKLSEKGAKYYEELKKKYGDMDFVLVSKDRMDEVKKNAAAYGSANKTVVLIDEEKIEKMANDEEYRKKYEGLIENGRKELKSLAQQINGNPSVKGFGMQVNDNGTVSFFAAMEKGNADMSAKLSEKREAKKAAAKAAEKKAKKKDFEEKLKEKKELETETITSDSIEGLLAKISELDFNKRADSVMTEDEMAVGGSIDFKG